MTRSPRIFLKPPGTRSIWTLICLLVLLVIIAASCSQPTPTPSVGEHATLLVDPGWPLAGAVTWSPTGDNLAITATARNDFAKIHILDLQTEDLRLLVETQEFHGEIHAETWSPDGKHLVFSSKGGGRDFKRGIWVVDVEGLADPKFLVEGISAAWSPEGGLAIIKIKVGYNNNIISIFLFDPETNEKTVVFRQSGITFSGLSWSPDGTRLVFALEEGHGNLGGNIYIVDTITEEAVKLIAGDNNLGPAWSPTGDMIAYITVDREPSIPTYPMHIMKSDGSCDIEVPGMLDAYNPTWSPDGRQIAFIADGGVYKVDLTEVFGDSFLTEGLPCP